MSQKLKAKPFQRESFARDLDLMQKIGSVALALEALDSLLSEKCVLRDGELMEKIERLALEKAS